jgi:hypothetical protein
MGYSVAIDADTILAGAAEDTIANNVAPGSAYTFSRTGLPARRQTSKLSDTDGATNDFFGLAVALDAGTTVIGAPGRGFVSVFFSPAPPPPPPPPPPLPRPSTKPVLSALEVRPTTIHLASVHSRRRRAGAITFVLSTAASVTLSFANTRPGRVAHTTCEKPTRANRRDRHCTRMVAIRRLAVRGKAGTNTIALAGTLLRRTPPPIGRYRLTATPTSAPGTKGTARTARFAIAK